MPCLLLLRSSLCRDLQRQRMGQSDPHDFARLMARKVAYARPSPPRGVNSFGRARSLVVAFCIPRNAFRQVKG